MCTVRHRACTPSEWCVATDDLKCALGLANSHGCWQGSQCCVSLLAKAQAFPYGRRGSSALAEQLRKAAQIHVAAADNDAHALALKLVGRLDGRSQ